jgi:hypothetical protein
MAEIIQQYTPQFLDENGITYVVMACGEERAGGTWEGWLEFHPVDKTGPLMQTGRETTQPDKVSLEYWASGLEPLYFEGAFSRAHVKL